LLAFRHGAPDDHVADQLRVQPRTSIHYPAQYVRQQIVRASVAKRAARLADRRARGGHDVSVLNLLAHESFSRRSVTQRLAGLEHLLDPGLGERGLGQLDKRLALQSQQPIFVHHRVRVHIAAA